MKGILSLSMAAMLLHVAEGEAVEPVQWSVGDVFVAGGDGAYQIFDRSGLLKHQLAGELGGYTTDCAFNPALDKLYTTNYTHSKVVVYEDDLEHELLQTIDANEASPKGHSSALVFDAAGNFYVGHPDGNALIHKYNEVGMLLGTYAVEVDKRGSSWIDLAADQQTLFYTSEGRVIRRFDVASGEQLAAFAALPGDGHAQALRLLPPGDGAGGLLVADGSDIKRLDGRGEVAQVYDARGRDSWFALNLDPDGRSFWAADSETDGVFRFNIATGAVDQRIDAGPGQTIFGVCLKGELTAGVPRTAAGRPADFSLMQNVPNPFNPTTQIAYTLPEQGTVSLVIYNLLGQEVRTLDQGERAAGAYRLVWDGRDAHGRDMASGVYIYRLASGNFVETRRMLLLK